MLRQVSLAAACDQARWQPGRKGLSRQGAIARAVGQDVDGHPQAVFDYGLRQQRLKEFGLSRSERIAPEQLGIGQGPHLTSLCRRQVARLRPVVAGLGPVPGRLTKGAVRQGPGRRPGPLRETGKICR